MVLEVKNPPASEGDIRDTGLISGLGWSPGGGHGNPLQYLCFENPMDRRTWQSMLHRGSQRVRNNWNNLACMATTANIILEPWRDESIFSKKQDKDVHYWHCPSPSKSDQTRKRDLLLFSHCYLQIVQISWTASQVLLSSRASWSLFKVTLIEFLKLSNLHPLPPSSPFAFNISQHQGLFQWVSSSHQVVRVLEFQLQQQSFQWVFRTDFI